MHSKPNPCPATETARAEALAQATDPGQSSLRRRELLAASLAPWMASASGGLFSAAVAAGEAPQRLVVAAFPLVDQIVKSALPAWQPVSYTHLTLPTTSRV